MEYISDTLNFIEAYTLYSMYEMVMIRSHFSLMEMMIQNVKEQKTCPYVSIGFMNKAKLVRKKIM